MGHCQVLIGIDSSRRKDHITNRQIYRNNMDVGLLQSMMGYEGYNRMPESEQLTLTVLSTYHLGGKSPGTPAVDYLHKV